jgi:hypothetical protein
MGGVWGVEVATLADPGLATTLADPAQVAMNALAGGDVNYEIVDGLEHGFPVVSAKTHAVECGGCRTRRWCSAIPASCSASQAWNRRSEVLVRGFRVGDQ